MNPHIFVKLSFRELCDSKLSGLHAFDNMTIIHQVYMFKNRQAVSSWDTNPWSNFCDPHWELICCNKWHTGSSEISTSPEIAVGKHFHAWMWHYNYPGIFMCWCRSLFVATSKFGLLTIIWHSATRNHLIFIFKS